jgi:hypothetical protein
MVVTRVLVTRSDLLPSQSSRARCDMDQAADAVLSSIGQVWLAVSATFAELNLPVHDQPRSLRDRKRLRS